MIPLHVVAHLRGAFVPPRGGVALDALLAWRVAMDLGLPPPRGEADVVPLEIPVARAPGGRFHLCSFGKHETEEAEGRFVNRRSPVEQMQARGDEKLRRVNITAGKDKSYRIPLPTTHAAGDRVEWWCVGDTEKIQELLAGVGYLGKKRSVGLGRVHRWEVVPCEPWGEGFPVVRDGCALRPLPLVWPGLVAPEPGYCTLTYPYWLHAREELCAIPT